MPPRDPSLPEGTDKIIDTNQIDSGSGATGGGGGGSRSSGTGGKASGTTGGSTAATKSDTTGSAFTFEKSGGATGKAADTIVNQLKDQVSTLKTTGVDRARTMADDGKRQATDLLTTIAGIIQDASGSEANIRASAIARPTASTRSPTRSTSAPSTICSTTPAPSCARARRSRSELPRWSASRSPAWFAAASRKRAARPTATRPEPLAGPAVLKRVEVTPPDHEPRDESIGELFSRLVEDGRAYARAELDLVKQIARHRAAKAKTGAILLGVGVTLLLCSLTALVLALVLGLATLIGPFGAGMAVFIVLAVAGGLLARAGAKGLASLGGDEEEKAALAKAEQLP